MQIVVLVVAFVLGACGQAGAQSSSYFSIGSAAKPYVLVALSCPTVRLCVGIDSRGRIATSTNPAGGTGTWSVSEAVDPRLPSSDYAFDVSCSSRGLCAALDNASNVLISTNPTGGARAWSITHLRRNLRAVSCAGRSLCVIVDNGGDVLTSHHPAAGTRTWTVSHLVSAANPLQVVSCPATSFCAATGGDGEIATSTDPTGGPKAWRRLYLGNLDTPSAISCPSRRFCAISDSFDGNVLVSKRPTGGARDWKQTPLASNLQGISCPSARLCLTYEPVTGDEGHFQGVDLFSTRDPDGRASAWSSILLDTALTTLSCPSNRLCVASDASGLGMIWRDP